MHGKSSGTAEKGNWDVYVSAFVSAPTGDPEYFFTTHCLQDSSKNRGGYYSETLEMLEQQLSGEFDTEKRTELAIEMTQTLLDDHMFFLRITPQKCRWYPAGRDGAYGASV